MERAVTILNKLGLHARPAAEFVKAARNFKSRIVVRRGEDCFSAASILEILGACLEEGCDFVIVAEGPDAEEALDRLASLLYEFKLQEDP
jgi:phosphotransferase system HPr (HPr) family protein